MSLSRIRATVSTASPVASVQIAVLNTGSSAIASKAKLAVSAQALAAGLDWDSLIANISAAVPLAAIKYITVTSAVELDYRGLNPVAHEMQLVVDTAVLAMLKGVSEHNTAVDYLHPFLLGKGLVDSASTAHQLVFSTDKLLADTPVTSESLLFVTAKPLSDTATAAEHYSANFQTAFTERVHYGDGPNQYDTYALNYFLEDYAREGFPSLHVFKGPTESLGHTETFSYVAQFVRTPNEPLAATELRVFSSSKVLADVFATLDIPSVELGKARNDSTHVADSSYRSIDKTVLEQLTATDDFLGTANLDDDETMVFGKYTSDSFASSDVSVSAVNKSRSEALATSESEVLDITKNRADSVTKSDLANYVYEKALSDLVDAGDEFNATALTDDGEVMIFGKTVSEYQSSLDEYVAEVGKSLDGTAITGDGQLAFDVGRAIDDAATTHEVTTFGVSKPLDDNATLADLAAVSFGANVSDRLFYPAEGPNQYDTYALNYFLEDYVREGFPALDFTKALSDTVYSTDDFYGVANADDDETMVFGKRLQDVSSSSEAHTFATGKALADSATSSDALTHDSGKALADTFSKSDTAVVAMEKLLSNTATTGQIFVTALGKGVYDTALSAEATTFTLSKTLADTVQSTDDWLGVANADDDETMELRKVVSDQFSKSDSTSLTPGKGLTETVGTSESGSIVWTDYWDINYTVTTSGIYVGNSQTF